MTLQHPAWCDPGQCDPDDRHWSRTLAVPAGLPGAPAFALRMFTTVYAPLGVDRPLVEFEVRQDDGPTPQWAFVEADADELRRLSAVLGAVLHVYDAPESHLAELPEPHTPEGGATS